MSQNTYKQHYAAFYCACFVLNYIWLLNSGLLLFSINPAFFINHLDFTRNMVMLTNIHHAIIKANWIALCFDILYIFFPLLLTISVLKNSRWAYLVAIGTSCFSLLYIILISSFSHLSSEGFIGWIFVPLIFRATTHSEFFYYFNAVRYVFILTVVSAALWKFRLGGLFNFEQMSGILISQHKYYLAAATNDWYSHLIKFLIEKKGSYLLYVGAAILELFFFLGLFTKKYDRLLILALCLFLATDYLLMQINYFSWLVFAGSFYFSQLIKLKPTT